METIKTNICKECVTNVPNVTLSKATQELLFCMAQLSDIYTSVYNIITGLYVAGEDMLSNFKDRHYELDGELRNLLDDVMHMNLLESEFKEM
ncbi:MAG TPA: hypothetical protein IAA79_00450 [Candidatus Avirikenella pullistercoris]|nr:hypothetical protein [Candidatus Avirikenella pullistercoris]